MSSTKKSSNAFSLPPDEFEAETKKQVTIFLIDANFLDSGS